MWGEVRLVALLVLPYLALLRLAQSVDARALFGYAALISVVTFFLYWQDKRKAVNGEWRTPEATLHLFEFLGGWPGAYLAQRAFRHKTSKVSYRVEFWTIVAFHEWLAFDFLASWHYLKKILSFLS